MCSGRQRRLEACHNSSHLDSSLELVVLVPEVVRIELQGIGFLRLLDKAVNTGVAGYLMGIIPVAETIANTLDTTADAPAIAQLVGGPETLRLVGGFDRTLPERA